MKAINIKMTCSACPSQWQGKLDDGRMFYARYRWGYLSLCVSENVTDDVMDAVCGEEVFGEEYGGEYDGSMGTDVMFAMTRNVIDWTMQNNKEKAQECDASKDAI